MPFLGTCHCWFHLAGCVCLGTTEEWPMAEGWTRAGCPRYDPPPDRSWKGRPERLNSHSTTFSLSVMFLHCYAHLGTRAYQNVWRRSGTRNHCACSLSNSPPPPALSEVIHRRLLITIPMCCIRCLGQQEKFPFKTALVGQKGRSL